MYIECLATFNSGEIFNSAAVEAAKAKQAEVSWL